MKLRKPAGRRLAEVLFANEVRNGGVGGGGGPEGPKIGILLGTGACRRTSFLGDFQEAHGLAYGGAMLDAAWRLRGRFGARVGRMLAPVGSIWGSFWRLLG